MKIRNILWVVALLLSSDLGMAGEKPASGSKFPVPPQQNAPWSLPEKVPDPKGELKTAVDKMFKLGLADPRGCAYHNVTVKEGDKIHDAHGWALPATQGEPTRYAIGWNGLIYPVESVGKEADLAVDMGILIEKGRFQAEPFSNYQDESLGRVISEFAATPRMMREWAAPYLLLRLGADITVIDDSSDPANPLDPFATVPPPAPKIYSTGLYLDSDHEQLIQFARLNRGDGIAAFIDKNDRLATNRLEIFDRVWAEVVHRISHEEGEREIDPFAAVQESLRPKLNSGWRSLLADAQRRLAREKAIGGSVIEKEIATWDEVENWEIEENWERDNSIPPASFERVVAAGSAAIAPLLACLENDSRWTRAQWGLREEDERRRMRPFVRVRDLAICALNRILRFQVVEVPYYSDYDPPVEDAWYFDAAARMKKICGNYGNACGGELWFRLLADEQADIEDQLQAAICIARPTSSDHYEGLSLLWNRDAQDRIEAPTLSIEGKQLRARHDPSVMDLMQRAHNRSRMMTDKAIVEGAIQTKMPVTCGDSFNTIYDQSHEFILLMEEWHHGNLDVLKEHYDWLSAALANMRKADMSGDFLISRLCEETLVLRFWAEDKTAINDYETLLRSSNKPYQIPIAVMKVVPQETGMDTLAKEAFLGEKALLSLINKPWEKYDAREGLMQGNYYDDSPSPLMVIPSYRRALIEALQTKTKQGTLVVTKNGCSVKYDSTAPEPASNTPAEPTLPGTGQEVRLCDIIADLLTPRRGPRIWGSPQFRLQDSLTKRDHAIEEWIKVLSNTEP